MDHVTRSFTLSVFDDVDACLAGGFDYVKAEPGEIEPIRIEHVVVVKKGTVSGAPSVDLILEDQYGQTYVCLVTGNLLKQIPC